MAQNPILLKRKKGVDGIVRQVTILCSALVCVVQKHTYREGTKAEKRKHPTLLSNQFICLYVWNMYLLLVVCIAADGDDLVEIFSMDLLFCCRYNSAIHLENFLPSICFSTSLHR